jgi:hypothetical protein
LGDHLNQRDDGSWSVNSGFLGVLSGRADLINKDTGDTYEVKTNACLANPSCLSSARGQLNDYLEDGLGHGLHAGSRFTVFEGAANIELSRNVMGIETSFIYSPFGAHDSGLTGYDRNVSFD